MLAWISDPHAWIALFTLTVLEIVLGIDNIVMLTILVGKLPQKDRQIGRLFGLSLAMATRILLLLSLVWIMKLTIPLFTVFERAITGRDIILIVGGLFLIAKSTHEIHQSMEPQENPLVSPKKISLMAIIIQIALIDIIFSLDSVITAVGLVTQLPIMIVAIVLSVLIMMFAAKPIGDYVDRHPTIKMLALSFLILVGFVLIADGMNFHIPKGYLYFAMGYSIAVEMLNIKYREKRKASSP
ncbi:MAG: TerC family protein [Candidatus Berkiellales bacterium]